MQLLDNNNAPIPTDSLDEIEPMSPCRPKRKQKKAKKSKRGSIKPSRQFPTEQPRESNTPPDRLISKFVEPTRKDFSGYLDVILNDSNPDHLFNEANKNLQRSSLLSELYTERPAIDTSQERSSKLHEEETKHSQGQIEARLQNFASDSNRS